MTTKAHNVSLQYSKAPSSVYPMSFDMSSFRASTLSNKNISKISWPILIKFHRYHYWGGELPVLGFGADLVRFFVPTENVQYKYRWEDDVRAIATILIGISSNLLIIKMSIKSRTSIILEQIGLFARELPALSCANRHIRGKMFSGW